MLSVNKDKTQIHRLVQPLLNEHKHQTGFVLLYDNLDAFAVRAMSIRDATKTLDLQYYIWNDDLTGRLLGYEILKAADRGVKVRLLLDDMNAHDKDALLVALEQHQNIEIRLFNPSYARRNPIRRSIELLFRGLTLNRRMHNKAWIVDKKIAIVGGRNIGDEYFDASMNTNFFDVDLLLLGEAITDANNIFNEFWQSNVVKPLQSLVTAPNDTLEKLRGYISELDHDALKQSNIYIKKLKEELTTSELFNGSRSIYWTDNAHIYSDPPEKAFGKKKEQWLVMRLLPFWQASQRYLRFISPYFVPDNNGMKLFAELRSRKVDIGVLTNSLAATDVMLVHSGYAPYRISLLKQGITLFELKPFHKIKQRLLIGSSGASLHTKAFVLDDRYGFVGSFNLDPRSARLNTEMGVLFEQPDIARELVGLYEYKIDKDNSYQLFLEYDKLRWQDESCVWSHEPEVGILKRTLTRLISYLPIKSQL